MYMYVILTLHAHMSLCIKVNISNIWNLYNFGVFYLSHLIALKSSNVDSTKEIIKIACNGRSKFIHYVSTVGIFATEILSDPISEDTAPSSQDR